MCTAGLRGRGRPAASRPEQPGTDLAATASLIYGRAAFSVCGDAGKVSAGYETRSSTMFVLARLLHVATDLEALTRVRMGDVMRRDAMRSAKVAVRGAPALRRTMNDSLTLSVSVNIEKPTQRDDPVPRLPGETH